MVLEKNEDILSQTVTAKEEICNIFFTIFSEWMNSEKNNGKVYKKQEGNGYCGRYSPRIKSNGTKVVTHDVVFEAFICNKKR